ncbi:MAG: primosomal protein N' [Anaerolineae bacterium]
MFAEVVVNLPVEGTFHYHIPAELAGRLEIGHLVEVSFGPQKAQGVILAFHLRPPEFLDKTKPIIRLLDRRPVLTPQQLALARWMAGAYLATLAECVQLFIPPGMSRRGDMLYTPVIDPDLIEAAGETQQRLLNLLKNRGPLRGGQIARALLRRDWQGAVRQLVERGLLLREPVLDPPQVRAKEVNVAELAVSPAAVEQAIAASYDPAQVPATHRDAALRRAAILRLLAEERRPLTVSEIYAQVPGSGITDLRRLAEDEVILLRRQESWRDPLEGMVFVPDRPPRLTSDQAAGWEIIRRILDGEAPLRPVLLHGVTGSGKTELYLRAVDHVLSRGQSAVVLVPEIALTPQTIRRFGARFPGQVGLIHSRLSQGERYDTWRRAHAGQLRLIIGPRSALFAPLHDLGLIVLDECHDDSYKQSPPIQPPYYHALPAAIELGRLHGALVLMGSATPNVTTYAASSPPDMGDPQGILRVELPARIMGHRQAVEAQAVHFHIDRPQYRHLSDDPDEAVMIDLPPVQVVDMRQELRAGNRSIFSRALAAALEEVFARGEQAILFLNRRGAATYVFCRECGYVFACPHDGLPLTWHTYHDSRRVEQGFLVCHHCNHRAAHPERCPQCGSDQVKYFGVGTERIEMEVRRRFPEARPLRWDRDTTGGKDAHDALLQQFAAGEANVLIGTQMIAKGLDLPLVTLVGVVSADTALYLPDYRSGERTFQLLAQVAGRAGRGLLGGRVVLQTYEPDHYAIRAAAEHNYHAFFEREMRYRREIGYPPFGELVRLIVRAETADKAREEAQRLHSLLSARIVEGRCTSTSLIGPAPCFYPRDTLFRWHVIVRGPDPTAILTDLRSSQFLQIDASPVSLL